MMRTLTVRLHEVVVQELHRGRYHRTERDDSDVHYFPSRSVCCSSVWVQEAL
jgi:hypothetical protein